MIETNAIKQCLTRRHISEINISPTPLKLIGVITKCDNLPHYGAHCLKSQLFGRGKLSVTTWPNVLGEDGASCHILKLHLFL